MPRMSSATENPHDTISDMIRYGTVATVNGGLATVQCGDIASPPLRYLTLAGLFGLYYPLSIGQQVVVLCPDGDITGGLIFGGIPCESFPLPGDGLKIVLKMPDGTVITYDAEAHQLSIVLAAGKITATAPDGFEFTGKSKFTGDMEVTGATKFTGDMELTGDLKVSGDSALGAGAIKFVKLADDTASTKVKAK